MITSLRLQNYRSYSDTQLEFEPGVTIIVGPNASGKTSVLEALMMVLSGNSFRGGDADVIRYKQTWGRLDSLLDDGKTRIVKIEKTADDDVKKSFILDGAEKARLLSTQQLPIVLFEPRHMNLLVGDPAGRREFLDQILTTTLPGYAAHLKNYRRVLAQRNRLLKQIAGSQRKSELFVWDLRLSELGGFIFNARNQLVERMNKTIAHEYGTISGKKQAVEAKYESTIAAADYTNTLLKQLTNNYEKDTLRGYTGAGPHRDELVLLLGNHDARTSASRGETRSLLLALKMLELYEVAALGTKPLLLLDDVFSELDGHRRRALAGAIKDYQALITTTDADVVVKQFAQATHLISMDVAK